MGEQIISNDVCGCDPEVHNYQTRQQAELFVNSVLLQLISEEGVDPQSIVVLTNDNDYDNWNNKVWVSIRLARILKMERLILSLPLFLSSRA